VGIAWLTLAVPAASAQTPATADDAQAAYERGDYQETLRLLGRTLSLKGKAAEGLDHYAMLMMKGESHLRLRSSANALSAFDEAAKVADDDKAAADARAVAQLIRKSRGFRYDP